MAVSRMLVGDEVLIGGGLETLRLFLLPALAEQCEWVVWAVPDHAVNGWRQRCAASRRLEFTGTLPPSGSALRMLWGIHRRMEARLPDTTRRRFETALRSRRFRSLARKDRLDHFLTTCAFDQPVPDPGIPRSAIVCDLSPTLPTSTLANIQRWVEAANHVICISRFTRDAVCALQPRYAEKTQALPLASAPLQPGGEHEILSDVPVFYYPAVAHPRKDHLTLFKACLLLVRRGRRFRCVLTGGGTEGYNRDETLPYPATEEARQFLLAHAAELSRTVECRGQLSAEFQAEIFAQTRCVVLASKDEGFGLPLAEALSWGLPVICTPLPPFDEQVELYRAEYRVARFPVGDAEALAECMLQQLGNPIARESKIEAARRMSTWTWTDVARQLLEGISAADSQRSGLGADAGLACVSRGAVSC